MPFKSKAQMKAAFGGYLGQEMKKKAKQWAEETPNISDLPNKKGKRKIKFHKSCVPKLNTIERYHDGGIKVR